MNFNFDLFQIIALAIAVLCAVIDVRTTKIPNLITFPATLVGLVMNFCLHGLPGLGNAFAGAVLGIILVCAPKMVKKPDKIAYGDAKLMMAMGAFLGWVGVLLVFFWFSLCWGFSALIRFCWLIPWGEVFNAIKIQNQNYVISQEASERIKKMLKSPIPVAPYVAAGVLLAEVLGDATLKFMGFS